MNTTYQLVVLGRDGMYSYGRLAASPELAKLVPGALQRRPGERLGINEITGPQNDRHAILVEAERVAGEWSQF